MVFVDTINTHDFRSHISKNNTLGQIASVGWFIYYLFK